MIFIFTFCCFSDSQFEEMSNPLLPRASEDVVNSPKGTERVLPHRQTSVYIQGIDK